ncbi:MAG TPA: hypothetical protein VIG30_06395 [Ktedonobacterales bacterium]
MKLAGGGAGRCWCWKCFLGVLVLGPLLVWGALALANNERPASWLGNVIRRAPAGAAGPTAAAGEGTEPRGGQTGRRMPLR